MATPVTFEPPIKLLVVEDHLALLDVTVETLAACGHDVIGIDSAEAMDGLPRDFVPDIAVLDLNLPGESGLSLARRLRRVRPGIGIIMVTALHAVAQKVAGYEHGADLYLTKPTAPEELRAAVFALAQRLRQSATANPAAFTLDAATHILHTPQGALALRSAESTLLRAFILAPDHTLEIFEALEQLDKSVGDQGKAQLEVLVSRLRSKLIAHGAPAAPIRALRGRGYRLCMSVQIK